MSHFDIRSRVLCEEIRQEKNNKYMILGVFSGDIFVNALPASTPLAFYFDGFVAHKGDYEFYIRVSGPGEGTAVISIKYTAHQDESIVAIVTPRFEVSFETEGFLKVETSEDNTSWETQIERKVRLGEDLWSLVPHRASTPETPKARRQKSSGES